MYFLENAFFLYLYFQGPEIFMQHQGLHKKGYIKIPWGLHKMGLHKHFDIFGGLHKKSGLGVTPKKKPMGGGRGTCPGEMSSEVSREASTELA